MLVAAGQGCKVFTRTFVEHGFQDFPGVFSREKCRALYEAVLDNRDWRQIFFPALSDYQRSVSAGGNNPRPGRNLAEKLDTDFIFGNLGFREEMTRVCGPRWRVLDYKFVMAVRSKSLPPWLADELGNRPIANLGEFVRPEHRDLTYFHGIDFHQDSIDFPGRAPDFITVYIYLDDVGAEDAPLLIIPDSFRLGATMFPHELTRVESDPNLVQYRSPEIGVEASLKIRRLVGPGGSAYYWHPFTLHGTAPQILPIPRVSMRILIETNERYPIRSESAELYRSFENIKGAHALMRTQKDIDGDGRVLIDKNYIRENLS